MENDCYNLIETDSLGNLINQSHIAKIEMRDLIKYEDYYYVLSRKFEDSLDNQLMVYKFNADLEIVDTVEYGGVNSEYGDKIIIGHNEHLIVSGNVKILDTSALIINIFMLEFDIDLNLVRDTTLPHNRKVRNISTVTKSLDNGYLLNYTIYEAVDWFPMQTRSGITKLDSNWNIEWEKISSDGTGLVQTKPKILATRDSHYIMQWAIDSTIFVNGQKIYLWHYLSKLNKNGKTIWRHDLFNRYPGGIFKILMAKNGDILGCGALQIYDTNRIMGWVFRMNADGEMLWERRFERPFDGLGSLIVFRDMIELEDERIALTGFWYDSIPGITDYMDGNIGLFVLDREGCIIENCADKILLSIDRPDVSNLISGIEVFPNPSSQVLNIRFDDIPNDQIDIDIYSLDGHKVFFKKIYSMDDLIRIEHELKTGLYFLTISSSNKILFNKKIIVQH